MSTQERAQALRGVSTGPDLPSCLPGDTPAQWAAPSSVPRVPRTGDERTFSGAAGEIYPAVSHFSRVCKYLGRRGQQQPCGGSFSAFYEPPRGAEREVSVAGYVGRPGSFTAGWHGVGKTAGLQEAARRHRRLPALNPAACGITRPEVGLLF